MTTDTDAYDRFAHWLADKFGPEAQGAFWRAFVLEPRYSSWDLWSLAGYVAAMLGDRPWAWAAVAVVWLAGRLWAGRSRRRYDLHRADLVLRHMDRATIERVRRTIREELDRRDEERVRSR